MQDEKIYQIIDIVLDHTIVDGVEDPEFEVWNVQEVKKKIKEIIGESNGNSR